MSPKKAGNTASPKKLATPRAPNWPRGSRGNGGDSGPVGSSAAAFLGS